VLIEDFPDWGGNAARTTKTAESSFVGIAIGSGSDEGLILVDDIPLQAGRILPLRGARYKLSKVRPGNDQVGLEPIRTLSLMLFEHPSELACQVARSNGSYDAIYDSAAFVAGPHSLVNRAIQVPFVGRREALFVITSETIGAGAFSYTVKGVRWQRSSGAVERYVLHTDPAATLSADETLAFYVGGDDNAELWDCLELYIATAGVWSVDAETIGELGAR
jgi:hypothetical protein